MALTLDQLKDAFKKPEQTEFSGPSNYFPFWNMKIGEQAIIRFLPDANDENPLGFMVEKAMHPLDINGEKKKVPCLKMYGDECPICKVSQAYYKNGEDDNGKKYWRKKSHITQALVVEDPLPPNTDTGETNEGHVRIVTLSWQLYEVIKEAFQSGELEEVPYAYEGGCNFIIKKTQQGKYATYATGSKFARKATDLNDEIVSALQEDMVDLSTLLPKKPELAKVEAMLEAALTGQAYNEGDDSGDDEEETVVIAKPAAKKATPTKVETPASDDGEIEDEADAILAQIKARRSKAVD